MAHFPSLYRPADPDDLAQDAHLRRAVCREWPDRLSRYSRRLKPGALGRSKEREGSLSAPPADELQKPKHDPDRDDHDRAEHEIMADTAERREAHVP